MRIASTSPDVTEILCALGLFEDLVGVSRMKREFMEVREEASRLATHPRVFCEEWGDPIIAGIGWIQEMIEIAGGIPTHGHLIPEVSTDRRIVSAEELEKSDPEIILFAWCGMRGEVNERILEKRPGWSEIDAVKNNRLYPVDDTFFVRPGPRLTEGARRILEIVRRFQGSLPDLTV